MLPFNMPSLALAILVPVGDFIMTRRILIDILIITVCLSDTLGLEIVAYRGNEIGLEECTLGSSNWCQDLQTAKRCQVVEECIQKSWENKRLPPDNSLVCTTCMEMVQETRDELRNGTTQELVKDVLDDACNQYFLTHAIVKEGFIIPVYIFQCLQQVDKFMPELSAIFSSRMDSQSVCSAMLFCNSEIENQLIDDDKTMADEAIVSDTCQDCKLFAVDAIETTKAMDRNVFKGKLTSLCNKLSNKLVIKGCKSGVQRNSNKFYNYITTQMTPDKFCSSATMCVTEGQFRVDQSDDDPKCEWCLEIAIVLKEILSQKEFETKVFSTLLSFCSWFGSEKQQCENDLKLYFDYVYQFIIHQLDSPNKFCQLIDICFSEEDDEDEVENSELQAITDISKEIYSQEEETLDSFQYYSDSNDEFSNISVTCQHCQTFATNAIVATKKLGRNAFKNKLLKMCTDFHVKKFLCKLAIKMNGDKIYNGITTQMTPNDFCIFTTMCGNGHNMKKTAPNDFKCEICKHLISEMRDFLELNTTKNTIHNIFLTFCSILGPFEKQCRDIMNDKYFEIVYKFLILAMEPESVCHLVNFCDVEQFVGLDVDEPRYYYNVE